MLDHWVNSDRPLTGGERGDTIAVIRDYSFIPSDGRSKTGVDLAGSSDRD